MNISISIPQNHPLHINPALAGFKKDLLPFAPSNPKKFSSLGIETIPPAPPKTYANAACQLPTPFRPKEKIISHTNSTQTGPTGGEIPRRSCSNTSRPNTRAPASHDSTTSTTDQPTPIPRGSPPINRATHPSRPSYPPIAPVVSVPISTLERLHSPILRPLPTSNIIFPPPGVKVSHSLPLPNPLPPSPSRNIFSLKTSSTPPPSYEAILRTTPKFFSDFSPISPQNVVDFLVHKNIITQSSIANIRILGSPNHSSHAPLKISFNNMHSYHRFLELQSVSLWDTSSAVAPYASSRHLYHPHNFRRRARPHFMRL